MINRNLIQFKEQIAIIDLGIISFGGTAFPGCALFNLSDRASPASQRNGYS
jgi:hypothetical protein